MANLSRSPGFGKPAARFNRVRVASVLEPDDAWHVRVPVALWCDATVSTPAKALYVALADVMTVTERTCRPTLARLAGRIDVCRRTVVAYLTELERAGWLTRTSQPGRTSLFQVNQARGRHHAPSEPFVFQPKAVGTLSPIAQLIYGVLLTFADNGTRQAWPSIATLAEEAGVSKAATKRAIRELEQAGWITRTSRFRNHLHRDKATRPDQTSNLYTLHKTPTAPTRATGEPPPGATGEPLSRTLLRTRYEKSLYPTIEVERTYGWDENDDDAEGFALELPSPKKQAVEGHRARRNPRARGTNPRARGTNPRANKRRRALYQQGVADSLKPGLQDWDIGHYQTHLKAKQAGLAGERGRLTLAELDVCAAGFDEARRLRGLVLQLDEARLDVCVLA